MPHGVAMIAGLWVEAVPLRLQLGGRLRRPLWIPPTGSVCREERLTRRGLLTDIAADFALLRLRVPEYPAGRAGSSLNSWAAAR